MASTPALNWKSKTSPQRPAMGVWEGFFADHGRRRTRDAVSSIPPLPSRPHIPLLTVACFRPVGGKAANPLVGIGVDVTPGFTAAAKDPGRLLGGSRRAQNCVEDARRAQLDPHVAPR
ncbi:hypothetical protein, partial [Streptomyces scabiei]|uniref:hypothetical protein n=1 Tax=Streptomyces scabiei TaxID=1930 RepID=UPI0029C9CD42